MERLYREQNTATLSNSRNYITICDIILLTTLSCIRRESPPTRIISTLHHRSIISIPNKTKLAHQKETILSNLNTINKKLFVNKLICYINCSNPINKPNNIFNFLIYFSHVFSSPTIHQIQHHLSHKICMSLAKLHSKYS